MQDIKTNKKIYRIAADVYFNHTNSGMVSLEADIELDDMESVEDYIEQGLANGAILEKFTKDYGDRFSDANIDEVQIVDWYEIGYLPPVEVMRRIGNKTLFDIDS